jgi:glycosyltransferase involved in cell wall biosynthesis
MISRVLVLHNRYQVPGGEDVVVANESEMLRNAGVDVEIFEVSNDQIQSSGDHLRTATEAFYSAGMRNAVADVVRRFQPDVLHVHNFFPRLSPSVYDAAGGAAVVQTLHNYRLTCANALLFRDGRICEECLGKVFGWPGILHRCYRDSAAGSAVVSGMNALHRIRGTWRKKVDRYIALTDFARRKFIEAGIAGPESIMVKPNTVRDYGQGHGGGGFFLYVGRLEPEKGVRTLLAAATTGSGLGLPLKIAGIGRLQDEVLATMMNRQIEVLGVQTSEQVRALMHQATALILPSQWYEGGIPLVMIEAFSAGLPVIASRIGAATDIIEDGISGLLVSPGNPEQLACAARNLAENPATVAKLQLGSHANYRDYFRAPRNLEILMHIYDQAISVSRHRAVQT